MIIKLFTNKQNAVKLHPEADNLAFRTFFIFLSPQVDFLAIQPCAND